MSNNSVSKKIRVKITLFPPFSKRRSKDEKTIAFKERSTVKDLIEYLASCDDHFKTHLGEVSREKDLRFRVLVIHNDHIALLDQMVSDGDTLKFLHPLQGG